jgi:hypothetical protein
LFDTWATPLRVTITVTFVDPEGSPADVVQVKFVELCCTRTTDEHSESPTSTVTFTSKKTPWTRMESPKFTPEIAKSVAVSASRAVPFGCHTDNRYGGEY